MPRGYILKESKLIKDMIDKERLKSKKEVFDDIDKILFDKHIYKDVYVRHKISGAELEGLKQKHLGSQKQS